MATKTPGSRPNTHSELPLAVHRSRQAGGHFQAAVYVSGLSLTCFLPTLSNRRRGGAISQVRACDPPRGPEEPARASAPQGPHRGNWDTLHLLLTACFSGARGQRRAYARGFELSDYIKVKVLRTEISKLQGKMLDLWKCCL